MHLFALSYLSLLWKWLWLSEIIALKARKLFLDVALNHCVSKFLQKKPRLRRAIVHWPSWTDFYSVKRPLLSHTIRLQQLTWVCDNRWCIRLLRCGQNIFKGHCHRTTHGAYHGITWNLVCFGDNTSRTPLHSILTKFLLSHPSLQ